MLDMLLCSHSLDLPESWRTAKSSAAARRPGRTTRQVFRGTSSLFRDLEGLFADSWARPGVDLQPEVTSLGARKNKATSMGHYSAMSERGFY